MTSAEIQALKPAEVKELIKHAGKSLRVISETSGVSKTTFNDVVNGKGKYDEETKQKVYEHLAFVLTNKEDINPLVWENVAMFSKLVSIGIKHKNFNNDETLKLIGFSNILEKYTDKQ